jgi:hypothetical protein
MKPIFWLSIDLNGTINYNTFSVVPPTINENTKKRAVPLEARIHHRQTDKERV